MGSVRNTSRNGNYMKESNENAGLKKKNIIPGINNYLDKLITAEGETQYMEIGQEIPPTETQRIKKRMHKKLLKSVRWLSI